MHQSAAAFLIEQEYMETSFRVGCQFAKCWVAIFSLFALASKEKSKALSFGSVDSLSMYFGEFEVPWHYRRNAHDSFPFFFFFSCC